MKIYTCTKPCILGGQQFCVGDTIPGELIASEREKQLIKYGLLAVSEAVQPAADENKGDGIDETPKAPETPASTDETPNPANDNPEGSKDAEPAATTETPKASETDNEAKAPGKRVQK